MGGREVIADSEAVNTPLSSTIVGRSDERAAVNGMVEVATREKQGRQSRASSKFEGVSGRGQVNTDEKRGASMSMSTSIVMVVVMVNCDDLVAR